MVKQVTAYLHPTMLAHGPESSSLKYFLLAKEEDSLSPHDPLSCGEREETELRGEIIWGKGLKGSRPGSKLAPGQEREMGAIASRAPGITTALGYMWGQERTKTKETHAERDGEIGEREREREECAEGDRETGLREERVPERARERQKQVAQSRELQQAGRQGFPGWRRGRLSPTGATAFSCQARPPRSCWSCSSLPQTPRNPAGSAQLPAPEGVPQGLLCAQPICLLCPPNCPSPGESSGCLPSCPLPGQGDQPGLLPSGVVGGVWEVLPLQKALGLGPADTEQTPSLRSEKGQMCF